MTPMAVKVIWVLTTVWITPAGAPMTTASQYETHDSCRDAAIASIETGQAKFSFCTEGYADPPQYLTYPRF